MDRLYQRYADPFSFINGMIRTVRFHEFVIDFWNTTEGEKEEKANWDVWLHKVWDATYSDFKQGIEDTKKNLTTSKGTIETTIKESKNILKDFNPLQDGGE
jgi:hypothetical protein